MQGVAGENGGERGREKQSANLQILHHGHQQGRWACSNRTQGDGNYYHRSHCRSPRPTTVPAPPAGPREQHLEAHACQRLGCRGRSKAWSSLGPGTAARPPGQLRTPWKPCPHWGLTQRPGRTRCSQTASSQVGPQAGESRRARAWAQQCHFPVRWALGQLHHLRGPNFIESSSSTHCLVTVWWCLIWVTWWD